MISARPKMCCEEDEVVAELDDGDDDDDGVSTFPFENAR